MMIDEADEFVAGPQNKHKRPGEPNMQGIPKRRRCMSPLLRGRQQNPVVNNHIGGKGPPVPMTQAQPDRSGEDVAGNEAQSLLVPVVDKVYLAAITTRKWHPCRSDVTHHHCPGSKQGYLAKIVIIHLFLMQQPFVSMR